MRRIKTHPVLVSIAAALLGGIAWAAILSMLSLQSMTDESVVELLTKELPRMVAEILLIGGLMGAFLVYPIILSFVNIVGVFLLPSNQKERSTQLIFELLTIALGLIYSWLFAEIFNVRLDAEWSKALVNRELHQPVWTGGAPTVVLLCLVGLLGYFVLAYVKLDKIPPLAVVLSMAAMYLGILECILWMIQTMNGQYWILSVLPINCILIVIKTIRYKIAEWNLMQREQDGNSDVLQGKENGESAFSENKFLCMANRLLKKAELWPVMALVLMWPLLGILLGVLILFGQKPDALIKAWTETADWRLSTQIAPQNAMYDEHYLCTVAAGGHEKVVKPLRMGERHGHRVVVNRQLCIANAFEQILEERTPRFHRAVRHFYDTYGFPVSRLIRTKVAADMVYVLMKPLEWIFLMVIYLCDVKPENRIAVQYLPRRKIDIS